MATKKKELLEQENSAPETTVPVENTPPTDEAQADMAAPSDGGDLNELLASMDQPDEETSTIEDDGSLPELTESEVFGTAAADTAAADALPGEDDTAVLAEGPDSDDGADTSAVPADEGAADVPGEPVSEAAEEPEPPKPKRATRRKKTAPAESTAPVEGITAEQSLLSRWLPSRKMRRLMIAKRLRQKLLPLWPNRRQRQPLLPLLLPGAPPLPAAVSLRSLPSAAGKMWRRRKTVRTSSGMRSTTPTAPAESSPASWAALSSWTTARRWLWWTTRDSASSSP